MAHIGRYLIHRCNTQRYTAVAQGYGRQRTPAAHLVAVHCRFKEEVRHAFNSVTGEWVVNTRYKLQVQRDEDIVAGDRVTGLIDEYGTAVPGDFEVAGGMTRRGASVRLRTLELNKVA
ncbi:MAG: hypothetical protein KF770_10680 [Anaerolineae bacterium]|nr:hypothetical protein [Anaerolineae bacterium]